MVRVLYLVFLVLLSACSKDILHDVSESRANSVMLALTQLGIDASKQREGSGWTITVAADDAPQALDALQRARILGERPSAADAPESGFILSREERTHFLERNLAGNLESTIERLPGVLEARVHLFLGLNESLAWRPQRGTKSASALLVVAAGTRIDQSHIRSIVSGAAGMTADRVTVVVSESELAMRPDPAATKVLAVSAVVPSSTWGLLLLGLISFGLFGLLLRRVLRAQPTASMSNLPQQAKLRPAPESTRPEPEVF